MIIHAYHNGETLEVGYHDKDTCGKECRGTTFTTHESFLVWLAKNQPRQLTRVQHQFPAGLIGWGWGPDDDKKARKKYVHTFNKKTYEHNDYSAEKIAAHEWLYEAVGIQPNEIEVLLGRGVETRVADSFRERNLKTSVLSEKDFDDLLHEVLIDHIVTSALRTKSFIDHLTRFHKAVFNSIKRRGELAPDPKSTTLQQLVDLMEYSKFILISRIQSEGWKAELIRAHRKRFWVSDNPILLLDGSGKLLQPWAFEPCSAIYVPVHSGLYVRLRKSTFHRKIDESTLNKMQARQSEVWVISELGEEIKPFNGLAHSSQDPWATLSTATFGEKRFPLRYVTGWPRDASGRLRLNANSEAYCEYVDFAEHDLVQFIYEMYGAPVDFTPPRF